MYRMCEQQGLEEREKSGMEMQGIGSQMYMSSGETMKPWGIVVIVSALRTFILCTLLRFLEKFPRRK